jgi:hypothetical protein
MSIVSLLNKNAIKADHTRLLLRKKESDLRLFKTLGTEDKV